MDVEGGLLRTGYFSFQGELGFQFNRNNNTLDIVYNSQGYPARLKQSGTGSINWVLVQGEGELFQAWGNCTLKVDKQPFWNVSSFVQFQNGDYSSDSTWF